MPKEKEDIPNIPYIQYWKLIFANRQTARIEKLRTLAKFNEEAENYAEAAELHKQAAQIMMDSL